MRRRDLFGLLGGALCGAPLTVRAQPAGLPVIGYLSGGSPGPFTPFLDAFKDGLRARGFAEGRNVAFEYRWAEGRYERLPELAADLVARKVSVIAATGGDVSAQAAKAATATIPIVFSSGDNPVKTGLVPSFSRPGGNLTGISFLVVELHAKRLELVTELVPALRKVALLANSGKPQTGRVLQALQEAVALKGIELDVVEATTEDEIDAAFERLAARRPDALIQQSDPFFVDRRHQIVGLAARHRIPAIYEGRAFAEAGGLVSYGASLPAVYRQLGVYAGRILAGESAGDLPVMQPTEYELIVNAGAAKAIGITVPEPFLLRADEVIG